MFLFIALGVLTTVVGRPALKIQDPNDPLVFAPGMSIGSRLQFGINVVPADWIIAGKPSEPLTDKPGPNGYRTLELGSVKGASSGLSEIPCTFLSSTPVISLFSQDGKKHTFTIDTGALETYVRPEVAESLNQGSDDPFPMALQVGDKRWLHVKVQVDRHIKILSVSGPDFPVEGIMGMNAVAAMQLKIDYRHHKIWARIGTELPQPNLFKYEFGPSAKVESLPIEHLASGRCAIHAQIDQHDVLLELDTGADLLGISTQTAKELKLRKVGEGDVLVQAGAHRMSLFLPKEFAIGPHSLLFPIVHEGLSQDSGLGGIGPSRLPGHVVVLDYPALRLYTAIATEDERVEQALGQLISGTVAFEKDEVILDMPSILGPGRVVLLKINEHSVYEVLKLLRKLVKNPQIENQVTDLFQDLNRHGTLTIRQAGSIKTVQIGQ